MSLQYDPTPPSLTNPIVASVVYGFILLSGFLFQVFSPQFLECDEWEGEEGAAQSRGPPAAAGVEVLGRGSFPVEVRGEANPRAVDHSSPTGRTSLYRGRAMNLCDAFFAAWFAAMPTFCVVGIAGPWICYGLSGVPEAVPSGSDWARAPRYTHYETYSLASSIIPGCLMGIMLFAWWGYSSKQLDAGTVVSGRYRTTTNGVPSSWIPEIPLQSQTRGSEGTAGHGGIRVPLRSDMEFSMRGNTFDRDCWTTNKGLYYTPARESLVRSRSSSRSFEEEKQVNRTRREEVLDY